MRPNIDLVEAPKINIAIDGFAACGKSTLAKALAKRLNYIYIDSGAMYRAVTLFFLDNQIELGDEVAVADALKRITIFFKNTPKGIRTYLNNTDVEDEIREMRVSNQVSPVATLSAVRRAMVAQQQQLGKQKGVVMDGRDIGTVVFPDAELKIFLTADMATRVQRRCDEMIAKGNHISTEIIAKNLTERDHIDSTRADSPLKRANDAIIIDNTQLTPEQQVELALQYTVEVI